MNKQGKQTNDPSQEDALISEETVELSDEAVELAAEQSPEQSDNKYQNLQDQCVRLQADFENLRKRTEQERESLVKFGVEQSVTRLLSVLDNLERGVGTLNEETDAATLYKSFQLMYKELLDGFTAVGLERINTVGCEFDPNFHEAAGNIDSAEYPENIVAAELRAGFILGDKVVRPALVQVSSGNAAAPANPFKDTAQESSV